MLTELDGAAHSPGKLVAFDPVSQSIRWSVDRVLPYNGGLMTTAGGLVFQGTADGHFEALSAKSGEQLWSVQTGSAINAAPASYSLQSQQFVLIPIGAGGGLQFLYPQMHSTEASNGPTRLLAFSLEGASTMPMSNGAGPALPPQPALDAEPEAIERGKQLYNGYCKFCHGSEAVTRPGGSVPDLRYATATTHETWHAIVVGGSKSARGMPAMDLEIDASEAIRQYVLSLAEEIRAQQ